MLDFAYYMSEVSGTYCTSTLLYSFLELEREESTELKWARSQEASQKKQAIPSQQTS